MARIIGCVPVMKPAAGALSMGAYLSQALSPAVINQSWRRLPQDRGFWVRGLPLVKAQTNLLRHVGELMEAVASGAYRAEPMRCFTVRKADGGVRQLCMANVRDKLLQRAVLTVLEPLGEAIFHDRSHGYRPGRSVETALRQVRQEIHQGRVWLGDADIQSCFDFIPHTGVLRCLRQICPDDRLEQLVEQWLDAAPRPFRPQGEGRGLPQGMVLSPFLCNLYLHQLDCALDNAGISFVRFADDFVLLTSACQIAHQALAIAGDALWLLGLALHPEKTQVIRSSSRYRFLGQPLPDDVPAYAS